MASPHADPEEGTTTIIAPAVPDGFPVLVLPVERGVVLRPWAPTDAPALAAAWGEADVAAQAAVPGTGDLDAAARWIDEEAARRAAGAALDLVIEVDGVVAGEVGLARLRLRSGDGRERVEHEVGWWVLPSHRRRGLASAAARALVSWASSAGGLPRVVARIPAGDAPSEGVATAVGLVPLGPVGAERRLWVAPPPGRSPGESV